MNIFRSFGQSLRDTIRTSPGVNRFEARYPRLVAFVKRRFDKRIFVGRPLTVLSILFLYILLLFAGIINDLVTSDVIVSLDIRANNMFITLRHAASVRAFLWITLLAKGTTVVAFGALSAAILWILGRRWYVLALAIAVAGSEIITQLGKIFFQRPRPEGAVYIEHSASFPSGHAAVSVAFYGFLAYLCWHSAIRRKYKMLLTVLALLICLAVGYSRIYLGVHYVSDVLGGYLVGLLCLLIGISVVEWELRRALRSGVAVMQLPHRREIAVAFVVAGMSFYAVYGLSYRPDLNAPAVTREYHVAADILQAFDEYHLPRFTETITGKHQEPISFLILARGDSDFVTRFAQGHWQLADPVRFRTTVKLFGNALFNHAYDQAPMTPSFWNGRANNFGFEKETAYRTARQRHHARFWKTELCTQDNDTLYVGTVSLDAGLKWFVTHRISPDIDSDRELLFHDLAAADSQIITEKVRFAGPMEGRNFTGDPFFTDGSAYVLQFK